jgi:predicted TIM-barrel fold metal-dependent hydrolase
VPRVVDFHTHAFPDALAERAVPQLESEADGARAYLDGKISSLLASMDRAGISISVVASIATKPSQWESILRWSRSIASQRIVPFASVHPEDPQALDHVDRIAEAGIRGVKLHPYYQAFEVDERRLYPLYERFRRRGLVFLCHTGFDIAFERIRRADPVRIAAVSRDLPGLKLVTSHLGAWQDWDEVERHLLGTEVYMDVSYSFPFMPPQKARGLLMGHPQTHLLFGSDSPWADQEETLRTVLDMELGERRLEALLCRNAARLLDLQGTRMGRSA